MVEDLENKADKGEWKMTPVANPANNYNPGFFGKLKDKLSDYKYPLWGLVLTGALSVVGALGIKYGPEIKRKVDNMNLVYENKFYTHIDKNIRDNDAKDTPINLKLNTKTAKLNPGQYFSVAWHFPNQDKIEIIGFEESINGKEWKRIGILGTEIYPTTDSEITGDKRYQMISEEMKIKYRTLIKDSQGEIIPYETTEVILTPTQPTPHPQNPSPLEQKTQTK